MANYNPRLAKINRSYTVEEIAELFNIHKHTVRNWLKQGLPDCGAGYPILVQGRELRSFLEARRRKNKQSCKPGQIYCVGCRQPVYPRSNEVTLKVPDFGGASLRGICPNCSCKIFRKVSMSKFVDWKGNLSITNTKA